MSPGDVAAPGGAGPSVFLEPEIRAAVGDALALASAERAFSSLARAEAVVPPPIGLDLPWVAGEVHVKGAALVGSPVFAFKVATGFYHNSERGLPSGSGLVLVFDATTGYPLALLADNGYLTDLRTAAAGALATRWLAPDRPLTVGLVGAGVQARLQLRLISRVRPIRSVRVWSRSESSRAGCASALRESLGVTVTPVSHVSEAVMDADLVVTVTPSRSALVEAAMLGPGTTVIAVGSDGPEKRELLPDVMRRADKIVTDLTGQCARIGELHHAIRAGVTSESTVYAQLGEIVLGSRAGRESEGEMIVCDLTGVGAQDAAIAEAAHRALTRP